MLHLILVCVLTVIPLCGVAIVATIIYLEEHANIS